jgi:hypothetical protein
MIDNMSDEKPTIRTENLDDSPAEKTLDEVKSVGDNHEPSSAPGMRTLNLETEKKDMQVNSKKIVAIISFVAIAAGFGTGFGAFKLKMKGGSTATESPQATQQVAGDEIKVDDVFGIKDDKTFNTTAEGYLKKGGINGEGSHSLLREGGVSQTVYLTSSITDLDKLVGMKVKVWGETFKGQTAGWLMDVGRVQVIELDAEPPVEE